MAAISDLATRSEHPLRRPDPGDLVGARYRLEGIAGAGGMATVWRARDERLDRPVAIKLISDALAANPAAVARFAREARTHARIQHPNLVQVYDYSITGARPYLVMEYIDGATLSERMDREVLPAAAVERLAQELLSAIACVHDHGVLHRDIKTGNVLLDRSGRARLTDFGLARLEDSTRITRPDEVVGTLRYLAPELIEGRAASRQSDLYALGVLLRAALEHSEPVPQLAELADTLTAQDPGSRPEDAHAVLDLLGQPDRSGGRAPRDAAPARVAPGDEPTRQEPTRQEPTRQEPARHYTATRVYRTAPQRPTPAGRHRNRLAAVASLACVLAATLVILAGASGGGAPHPGADSRGGGTAGRRASGTHTTASVAYGTRTRSPTLDQLLSKLAAGVRHAAR